MNKHPMKIKPLTKITKVTASFVSNFQEIFEIFKSRNNEEITSGIYAALLTCRNDKRLR